MSDQPRSLEDVVQLYLVTISPDGENAPEPVDEMIVFPEPPRKGLSGFRYDGIREDVYDGITYVGEMQALTPIYRWGIEMSLEDIEKRLAEADPAAIARFIEENKGRMDEEELKRISLEREMDNWTRRSYEVVRDMVRDYACYKGFLRFGIPQAIGYIGAEEVIIPYVRK
jgi:hypothetical protein